MEEGVAIVGGQLRRGAGRWRCAWIVILLALVACSRSPSRPVPDPAATTTRAAELAQLTQVAATLSALRPTPATPQVQTSVTSGVPNPPPRSSTRPATAIPTAPQAANTPAVSMIPLVANDLIYDQRSKRLFATTPGRAEAQGNSLVAIDPSTGTVGTPVPLGSEPNQLALSDDGRYLYAVLSGASAIRRVDVAQGQADLEIALTGGPDSGPCSASDVEVVPGLTEIIAVAQSCQIPGRSGTGITAYNGTTRLAGEAKTDWASGDITFCGDDRTLYGFSGSTSLHVDSTGVTAAGKQLFAFTSNAYVHQLLCAGDRLYSSGGEVVDVRTGAQAGKYAGLDAPALVCPDATVGRVFFFDFDYAPAPRLYIYDQARFTLLAKIDFPDIPKPADSPYKIPGHLVRWGDDGLAFLNGEQLILMRSPLISGQATLPPPTRTGPAPTATLAPRSSVPPVQPTPGPGTRTTNGGVTSNKVALVTNDIVYDPGTKKIYASVPGISGPIGNSVMPIDPTTGMLGTPIPVGSEPAALALSDNGKYLYVTLIGASAIRRINLAEQKAELQFSVGSDPGGGPLTPGDLAVMPGHPDTVAVTLRSRYGNTPGVALFVNGAKLPNVPANPASNSIGAIEFCDSPSELYGFNTGDTGADFYWLAADASGLSFVSSQREVFTAFGDIVCEGGRIYASSGQVLDPVAHRQVGRCPAAGLVRPDSTLGRIFYLTNGPSNTSRVIVCDQQRFTQLGSFEVPAVPPGNGQHGFIRWGQDGLAYRGGPGELFLVQSPLVRGQP
jgi:sugar lactone lactonase YvrE